MYAKLIVLTLGLLLIAAALLLTRHERQVLRHETIALRGELDQTRQALWRAHAEAAVRITPQRLYERIVQTTLAFEPAVPHWPLMPETRVVEADGDPRQSRPGWRSASP
jgi:hypothetical protein